MTENRICNPLWSNVFGCRTSDDPSVVTGNAENYSADVVEERIDGNKIEPTSTGWKPFIVMGVLGVGAAYLMNG